MIAREADLQPRGHSLHALATASKSAELKRAGHSLGDGVEGGGLESSVAAPKHGAPRAIHRGNAKRGNFLPMEEFFGTHEADFLLFAVNITHRLGLRWSAIFA